MRANIIYVINILRMYSTQENPLTHTQIRKLLHKHYDPINIDKSTIPRILKDYICNSMYLNDLDNVDGRTSFRIRVSEKDPITSSYIDITESFLNEDIDDDFSNRNTPAKSKRKTLYYYYEPCIQPDNLFDLMNMMECHPYYSSNEIILIQESLRNIAPAYFKKQTRPIVNDKNRPINAKLQENLHHLHPYIHSGTDIQIVYSYYNEEKQLIPHTGYDDMHPHRITPYRIIWTNGACYLAAFNSYHNDITHYRVDRITKIEPVPQKETQKNIGPRAPIHTTLDYAKSHPYMMSGETGRVCLLCKKSTSIINRLIDFFGIDNFHIATPDHARIKKMFPNKKIDFNEWIDVSCSDVSLSSVNLWAKKYCTDCIVYYPPKLADQIKSDLQNAMKLYE